jgi:hypothetical protein
MAQRTCVLLMEYGADHTELTQDRREAEWRANGQD